jgi:hypothetical protein
MGVWEASVDSDCNAQTVKIPGYDSEHAAKGRQRLIQSVFPRYLHNHSSVTRWEGAVRRMLAFSLDGATAWCFAVTRMTRYSIEVPRPAKVLRAVARSYLKYTVQRYAIAKCENAVAKRQWR